MFDKAADDLRRGVDPRAAAEWAYLGIHTALENLVGETFSTTSAQTHAVARLAQHNKKLAKEFNELKSIFNGDCFYRGAKKCDVISVAETIGRARHWMSSLPAALPELKRKR